MKSVQKLLGIILISMIFVLVGLLSPLILPRVHSQNPNCISVRPRINNGILSAPSIQINSRIGTDAVIRGQCVIDPIQAGIVSFKIPTYSELKNTYFERKTTINSGSNQIDKQTRAAQTGLDFQGNGGGSCAGANCSRLWLINGDLNLRNQADIQIGPSQKAVIFVEGNLNLGDLAATFNNTSCSGNPVCEDIRYGTNDTGIVYIVKGNVNFGRNIHIFDGLIIAQGVICSSYDGICREDLHGSGEPGGETKQLIINGNLVSLSPTNPIRFERNLLFATARYPTGNDTTPAETINVQPKYLVIMRRLLSETFTVQTEDTQYARNQ